MDLRKIYLDTIGIEDDGTKPAFIASALLADKIHSVSKVGDNFYHNIAKGMGKNAIPRCVLFNLINNSKYGNGTGVVLKSGEKSFKEYYKVLHGTEFDKVLQHFVDEVLPEYVEFEDIVCTACHDTLGETYEFGSNVVRA